MAKKTDILSPVSKHEYIKHGIQIDWNTVFVEVENARSINHI
jgi:hypothetical protein